MAITHNHRSQINVTAIFGTEFAKSCLHDFLILSTRTVVFIYPDESRHHCFVCLQIVAPAHLGVFESRSQLEE